MGVLVASTMVGAFAEVTRNGTPNPPNTADADAAASSQIPPRAAATRSLFTICLAASFAAKSSHSSSTLDSLSLRPMTPPRLLSSSAAIWAPSRRSWPRVAASPDRVVSTPKVISPRGPASDLLEVQPVAATVSASTAVPAATRWRRRRRRVPRVSRRALVVIGNSTGRSLSTLQAGCGRNTPVWGDLVVGGMIRPRYGNVKGPRSPAWSSGGPRALPFGWCHRS